MLKKAFVLFFLVFITSGYASIPLVLDDNLEEKCLCREYVDFFEDTSTKMGITEILQLNSNKFVTSTAQDLMNDNISSSYWLKFTIKNNCTYNRPFNVEMFDFDINQVSLYIPVHGGGYREERAGFDYKFNTRHVHHKNLSFNLPISEGETATFYMRFYSTEKNVLEPIVRSYNQTLKYGLTEYILFGVFYGLLLLMIFYNLLYFIILKKAHYIFYVFYATGILLYLMSQNGTGFQFLWANYPQINPYIGDISLFVGIVSMLLFTISFLELKTKNRSIYTLVIVALILRIATFPIQLACTDNYSWLIIDVIAVQISLFSGFTLYKQGFVSAKWFLMAFLILDVCFLVTTLEILGWIHSGIHTVYSLNFGIILQFVFLSISIAESVKDTYKQMTEAQASLIKLKEDANKNLERKVIERTKELRKQKDIIEEKNQQIMASVRYAKNIQNAVLPDTIQMSGIGKNFFVLNLPRDIVSGDFYWVHMLNEDKYIVTAVDCTGHGIPGAFMSLIGINLLNRIVSEGIHLPNEILSKLHQSIQEVLKQKETKNADGMDMAICLVDKKEKLIHYSGAKNPLIYIQDNKITKIKASRNGIGGTEQPENIDFELHTLDYKQKAIQFYLFSDGYVDQFGGGFGKKFYTRNFMKLLHENQNLSMKEQYNTLLTTINNWMGTDHFQVDDILVLGIKED